MNENQVHPDYGPAGRFSEHQPGDSICYPSTETGEPTTGTILYVQEGPCYVVAPDAPGFLDIVKPHEVITAVPTTL